MNSPATTVLLLILILLVVLWRKGKLQALLQAVFA